MRSGWWGWVGCMGGEADERGGNARSTEPLQIKSRKRKGLNMNRFDRITVCPAIVSGQPCIRGMRLTVKRVVEAVGLYPNRDELQHKYPELEAEDILQALDFAACNLDDRMIHLEAA